MYLSYLDSSARPSFDDVENYVVASITVHEHQWYYVRGKIEEIKKKHFPHLSPEYVEFHAKDMINRTGIYRKLEWTQIYGILDDLFRIITDSETHLTIIASLIVKSELRKKN